MQETLAQYGKWVTFQIVPRVGDCVVYNSSNEMGYSADVTRVIHWLENEVVVVWAEDDNTDMFESSEEAMEHFKVLLKFGFIRSEQLYYGDD